MIVTHTIILLHIVSSQLQHVYSVHPPIHGVFRQSTECTCMCTMSTHTVTVTVTHTVTKQNHIRDGAVVKGHGCGCGMFVHGAECAGGGVNQISTKFSEDTLKDVHMESWALN